MPKRIVWLEGGTSIAFSVPNNQPFPFGNPQRPGETEAQYLDRIASMEAVALEEVRRNNLAAGLPPPPTMQRLPDQEVSDMPPVDDYQGAWEWNGSRVTISLLKAREIHAKKITLACKEKLLALLTSAEAEDVEGKTKAAALRKLMKDVGKELDKITDIAALKAYRPDLSL